MRIIMIIKKKNLLIFYNNINDNDLENKIDIIKPKIESNIINNKNKDTNNNINNTKKQFNSTNYNFDYSN